MRFIDADSVKWEKVIADIWYFTGVVIGCTCFALFDDHLF